MYVYITESFCCTAEMGPTLKINTSVFIKHSVYHRCLFIHLPSQTLRSVFTPVYAPPTMHTCVCIVGSQWQGAEWCESYLAWATVSRLVINGCSQPSVLSGNRSCSYKEPLLSSEYLHPPQFICHNTNPQRWWYLIHDSLGGYIREADQHNSC